MTSFHETAFNVFKQFPDGLACFEFIQLMDTPNDRRNTSARLSQFVNEGLAVKDGERVNPATGQSGTVYKWTGKEFCDRIIENREPERKRKRPTDRELIELRKFRAMAIAKYPDLAVDPRVEQARRQIANVLRAEGNPIKAALFEQGDMDDSETMRIALSFLAK